MTHAIYSKPPETFCDKQTDIPAQRFCLMQYKPDPNQH